MRIGDDFPSGWIHIAGIVVTKVLSAYTGEEVIGDHLPTAVPILPANPKRSGR